MTGRFLLIAPLIVSCFPVARASDWAQFRGPIAGVAADSPLPTDWAPDRNIQWKAEIPGYGWSQPIVVRDRVYVTTATTENQQRPQVGGFGGRGGGPGFPPGGPGGFQPGKGKGPPPGKGAPGPDQANAGPGGPRGFGGRGGFGSSPPPNAVYQW